MISRVATVLAVVVAALLPACNKNKPTPSTPEQGSTTNPGTAEGSASKPSVGKPPEQSDVEKCGEGNFADMETVPPGLPAYEVMAKYSCEPTDEELDNPPKSDVDAATLAATTTEYYGKTLILYGTLEVDDSYGGRYADAKTTHYSFAFKESGDRRGHQRLHVYGEKKRFSPWFKAVLASRQLAPFKVKVLTDASHRGDDIFTLVELEPATDWTGRCCLLTSNFK